MTVAGFTICSLIPMVTISGNQFVASTSIQSGSNNYTSVMERILGCFRCNFGDRRRLIGKNLPDKEKTRVTRAVVRREHAHSAMKNPIEILLGREAKYESETVTISAIRCHVYQTNGTAIEAADIDRTVVRCTSMLSVADLQQSSSNGRKQSKPRPLGRHGYIPEVLSRIRR